jgi:hypothetical protein
MCVRGCYGSNDVRDRLIEASAALRRREQFHGTSAERQVRAKSLVRPSPACRPEDADAIVEALLRLPLPFMTRLAEQGWRVRVARSSLAELYPELPIRRGLRGPVGWHAASAALHIGAREIATVTRPPSRDDDDDDAPPFPAGFFLMRAVGQAVDVALGRRGARWSATCAAWRDAAPALERELGPFIDPALAWAELFARSFVKDKRLLTDAPTLAAAFEATLEAHVADDAWRTHPTRRLQINAFLRAHVLRKDDVPAAAHAEIARLLERERGPWDRDDAPKHVKRAGFRSGMLEVETRFGLERYSLEDGPGARPNDDELRARAEVFLDRFVRPNPRVGAELKQALEATLVARAPEVLGPWFAEGFEQHVRAVAEQRGRLVVKTAGGDAGVSL